jgi:hypothetical protein
LGFFFTLVFLSLFFSFSFMNFIYTKCWELFFFSHT